MNIHLVLIELSVSVTLKLQNIRTYIDILGDDGLDVLVDISLNILAKEIQRFGSRCI